MESFWFYLHLFVDEEFDWFVLYDHRDKAAQRENEDDVGDDPRKLKPGRSTQTLRPNQPDLTLWTWMKVSVWWKPF